ncbi:fumarylacetoacetase [Thioclava sp. BHET1]|nr:fumarylacetoacetase [Thioclava sp. BHET1]
MARPRSWIESANEAQTDFPLMNLPCGVFSLPESDPRCGVAIGDKVIDIRGLEEDGLLVLEEEPLFDVPFWNELMERGPVLWTAFRDRLTDLLAEGARDQLELLPHLYDQVDVILHMPFLISEYTDFYASRAHAERVGTVFRGPENALPPNWLHMPIGYNGRASSVGVSGQRILRPTGQIRRPGAVLPDFGPSERFDFELELGAVVGQPCTGPISVAQADHMIFGYVLLNDWSARDLQAWEYQPLGPFLSKASATTISPWIVMAAALAPFRTDAPPREMPLLPYLTEPGPMHHDITLEVALTPAGGAETILCRSNARTLYYSTAQMLCHHASAGCPMTVGDLLGSGTISGEAPGSAGCLLELTQGGAVPVTLTDGTERHFLQDGDRVTLRGHAQGRGYRIGFGSCEGTVLPARAGSETAS